MRSERSDKERKRERKRRRVQVEAQPEVESSKPQVRLLITTPRNHFLIMDMNSANAGRQKTPVTMQTVKRARAADSDSGCA